MNQLSECDIFCSDDAKWIAQTRADLFVKSYSKMHQLLHQLGIESVSTIMQNTYSRKHNGCIRRSLPAKVILTVDRYIDNIDLPCKTILIINNKETEILKLGSRKLNDVIKITLKKIVKYHPAIRYNFDQSYFGDIRQTWTNLWLIKNPTLRAIRLKILHKDIWTQEKRCKLGIVNSNACEICGEPETTTHQLVSCINAMNMWTVIGQAVGRQFLVSESNCPDEILANLMKVSNNSVVEIVKSAIFKLLIQIDRSRHLSIKQINNHIIFWLRIELMAVKNKDLGKVRNNNALITSYYNIIKLLSI